MQKNEVAKVRSHRLRDFFYHLVVYLFVVTLIAVVASGAFIWLALFWGLAVALHGVYAYFG